MAAARSGHEKPPDMKIGILGGTFDPIHLGHLKLAESAVDSLGLDKLIFMPCLIQPHKKRKDIAPPEARLEMISLAIKGRPEYELSDYEITRGDTSFSAETLAYFKKTHPHDEIFFIIGSDSYKELSSWNQPDQIRTLARIAVARRPLYPYDTLEKDMIEIRMEPSSISSSEIRSMIKRGESIKKMVPESVENYIARKKLYRPKP